MTRTLDRQHGTFQKRLEQLLSQRSQLMDHYLSLLVRMEGDLSSGNTLHLDQQVMAEKELLLRLGTLHRVLSSPELCSQGSRGKADQLYEEKNRAVKMAKARCVHALDRHIALVSRQIASLKALPHRPAAFSRVDQPSRLDITG
jgi:hypothetical protein